MNGPRTLPPRTPWTHWYRRALPAYWIFLFCVSHFPKLELHAPIRAPDKVAHVGAFALLAFLFWRFAESLHATLSGRFVFVAAFWLAAYAAFDEYLQQFVGRRSDWLDWACDAAGIVLTLGVLEWRRRARHVGVRGS